MIEIHEEAYFVVGGRCKKLLMMVDMCEARNQMWQCKADRRNRFLAKVNPYVKARISDLVYRLGYFKFRTVRTGSRRLSDVSEMRNQSYRVVMTEPRQEQE